MNQQEIRTLRVQIEKRIYDIEVGLRGMQLQLQDANGQLEKVVASCKCPNQKIVQTGENPQTSMYHCEDCGRSFKIPF